MDDSECVAEFRVKKHDLPDLAAALQIPNQFVCHQRSVADGMEGLCMLLRRSGAVPVKSPESHLARSHVARNQSHVARNFIDCINLKKSNILSKLQE